MDNNYHTAPQLADALGVNADTVLRWTRRKIIPHIRPIRGKPYLYDLEAVLIALAARGRTLVPANAMS